MNFEYNKPPTSKKDYISICICSYKRPHLLERLLKKIQNLKTEDLFNFSTIVVDNDFLKSAEHTVAHFAEESLIEIAYHCEPLKNISLARNKAIKKSMGNFVAFIDDDEYPVSDWLFNLYKTLIKYNADGVLGPVKPYFEVQPDKWIVKGKLWERESFPTGAVIESSKDTRTGNVLLKRDIIDKSEIPFDPKFGLTGGEDTDFFDRMIKKGKKFIWCNEAWVYENVPPERLTRIYFFKRAFNRGVSTANTIPFCSFSTLKSIFAVILYASAMPFLALFGHHMLMNYLIKECDHLGKLLAYSGIKPINNRVQL